MTVRPATDDDREAIAVLMAEAFARGRTAADPALVEIGDRLVLTHDGAILATATATLLGQHIAGSVLATAAVRGVAVADSGRGRGLGRELMSAVLMRLREDGVAQSVLFPSVPAPYRQVGYEIAGERRIWRAPLHSLPVSPAARPVEAWDESDLDGIGDCYGEFASDMSGLLMRSPFWWRDVVLHQSSGIAYRRAIREGGRITGYLVYTKEPVEADLEYYYDVAVRDLAWTTPAAGASLLSYLSGHRGLGVDVRWPAPEADPWTLQLPSRVARVDFSYPWMLRLVDPIAALVGRRYPVGLRAELRLTVTDPVLRPSELGLEMTIADGRAAVSTARTGGGATLDVGALAALHSGWVSGSDLARAGRLVGTATRDVQQLDAVFAGPRPWLMEMF